STGSACSTGSLEPSHVIMALGLEAEHAHGSVRFSLGRENTEEDIDLVLKKMPGVVERLRKMSPLYSE
ncbi:MAG: cysteine desulfurase NifS, partial [Bacteroidota bacterium]